MILSVTLNSAIDRIERVQEWKWGKTIRSLESCIGMGGKGADASWVLGELGIATTATGFAAGLTGKLMISILQQKGVVTDFVEAEGETRSNLVLIGSQKQGQTTITTETLWVSSLHLQCFEEKYLQLLPGANALVLGGSVPTGVPANIYKSLITTAKARGVPVVFDSSGVFLRSGLQAKPDLIKPNQEEISALLGWQIKGRGAGLQAAREVKANYGCDVIVTLGGEGAVAVSEESAWQIEPMDLEVRNAAGAGDAVLAGMAYGLSQNWTFEESLRLAFACANAVLLTLPTADCRREDVERLREQVIIRRIAKT